MSIKNVAVLAAYLEINPLLELLPDLASQLSVTDFNLDDLKNAAAELPDMSVDGLKKFVEAGFGTTTKMRTGDKRKNQNVKKAQPPKKPKVFPSFCSIIHFYRSRKSQLNRLPHPPSQPQKKRSRRKQQHHLQRSKPNVRTNKV